MNLEGIGSGPLGKGGKAPEENCDDVFGTLTNGIDTCGPETGRGK